MSDLDGFVRFTQEQIDECNALLKRTEQEWLKEAALRKKGEYESALAQVQVYKDLEVFTYLSQQESAEKND